MQEWLKISLLLCTFGFFRELRPSEPFVTEFLTGEQWHNITVEQMNKDLYPLGTYSVLAQLVVVFLITDMLRYKPVIIASACAGIVMFSLLLWTRDMLGLQVIQIFYGTFMACEVAYYTYIYAKVDRSRYQLVTGHTRSAILCGKFLAGVLAQLLVSTSLMDYRELNYISLPTQIVSLFVGFALPSVQKSLYFYAEPNKGNEMQQIEGGGESPPDTKTKSIEEQTSSTVAISAGHHGDSVDKPKFSGRRAIELLGQHIVSAYTKPTVIQWSIWWAFATCGQLQSVAYVQILWKEIDENNESFYNGGVEAAVTLLGAAGAMTAGMMNSNRHKDWHIWILTICSLLMGAFLIISAITNLIWVAYVMYILFGTFYYFVITIASAIVAENLCDDSFGLIFGINTMAALLLQTILTVVVVTDAAGLGLAPRPQYIVYGGYFIALAVVYCVAVAVRFVFRSHAAKAKS